MNCEWCDAPIEDGDEAQCETCGRWFCPDCSDDYEHTPECLDCANDRAMRKGTDNIDGNNIS